MSQQLTQQFAHVLLFSCPQCERPLASVCTNREFNLEQADGHWFHPRCQCGWRGDVVGVAASKHWVEPWPGNPPLSKDDPGSCETHFQQPS
jgi:hypothetical protein